jgi:hypothetical protein
VCRFSKRSSRARIRQRFLAVATEPPYWPHAALEISQGNLPRSKRLPVHQSLGDFLSRLYPNLSLKPQPQQPIHPGVWENMGDRLSSKGVDLKSCGWANETDTTSTAVLISDPSSFIKGVLTKQAGNLEIQP